LPVGIEFLEIYFDLDFFGAAFLGAAFFLPAVFASVFATALLAAFFGAAPDLAAFLADFAPAGLPLPNAKSQPEAYFSFEPTRVIVICIFLHVKCFQELNSFGDIETCAFGQVSSTFRGHDNSTTGAANQLGWSACDDHAARLR
jgi:hypothetical protein